MEHKQHLTRDLLIAAGGIILLAAAVLVYNNYFKDLSDTRDQTDEGTGFTVQRQNVDTGSLPAHFPDDIPIEEGAEILQNYEATSNDGRVQATRTFQSVRTVDQNFQFYSRFLEGSPKWTMTTSHESDRSKSVFARDEKGTLAITIANNISEEMVTVDISYTLRP